MPNSSEIIISDTSCLILLYKIDRLELLKEMASHIFITKVIQKEFGKELPDWIEIKNPLNHQYQKILELDLDAGEASAIALGLEIDNSILIIDDLKGRKIAEKLELKFSGTFGLILRAKQLGILNSIKPVLEEIKNTNFRFSNQLFELMLKEAGE